MSTPTQVGLLYHLIVGLYDDLAQHDPERLLLLEARLRRLAEQEDDPGSKVELEKAVEIIGGFTAQIRQAD